MALVTCSVALAAHSLRIICAVVMGVGFIAAGVGVPDAIATVGGVRPVAYAVLLSLQTGLGLPAHVLECAGMFMIRFLPWWLAFTLDRAALGACIGLAATRGAGVAGIIAGAVVAPLVSWLLLWRWPDGYAAIMRFENRLFPSGRDLSDFCVALAVVLALLSWLLEAF